MTKLSKVIIVLLLWIPSNSFAEDKLIDDFTSQPGARWQFIADTVMGGVSNGEVQFLREGSDTYARMTGTVSTENKGGFIQVRTAMSPRIPKNARGIRLIVRGNNQRYFIHLRTSGTILPWQYYQAAFEVSREWSEVRLPFVDFRPSGIFLRKLPMPENIKSLGIVAFGRDHIVEIDALEVSFY